MVTAIIALLIQYLPLILQTAGVLSPSITTLVQQLGAALPGLIVSLAQGKGPTQDAIALLQAFQTEIVALKAHTSLPAETLSLLGELDLGITDALTAYATAQSVDDPTSLTLLPINL